MKLDLPSLTQAAESRINNGACLVTVYASTILELIRQHRVMEAAMLIIARPACAYPDSKGPCGRCSTCMARKTLEEIK